MGLFSGVAGALGLDDAIDSITGKSTADATKKATADQIAFSREALDRLTGLTEPYRNFGESALPGYQTFIDDPTGASFLQNNPIFNQAADVLRGQVGNQFAAQGKFNSGGMVNELFKQNVLLGDQLTSSAANRLLAPISIGANASALQGSQGTNLLTGIGNSASAGRIGAANAEQQGWNNLLNLGLTAGGMFAFSDENLKTDIEPVTDERGKVVMDELGNVLYEYSYKSPERYIGKMAQDVEKTDPANVLIHPSGYKMVTKKHAPVRVQ